MDGSQSDTRPDDHAPENPAAKKIIFWRAFGASVVGHSHISRGLGNQDALLLAIHHECQRYQQERLPLSLALIRVTASGRDSLPTDPHGIQMLQRHLAGALSRTARRADALCRREDGVFALVLRATDQVKGLQAARRIHAAAAREPFLTATSKQSIALLIGLATCGGALSSPEDLLQAAERALGRAGQAGQMIVIA